MAAEDSQWCWPSTGLAAPQDHLCPARTSPSLSGQADNAQHVSKIRGQVKNPGYPQSEGLGRGGMHDPRYGRSWALVQPCGRYEVGAWMGSGPWLEGPGEEGGSLWSLLWGWLAPVGRAGLRLLVGAPVSHEHCLQCFMALGSCIPTADPGWSMGCLQRAGRVASRKLPGTALWSHKSRVPCSQFWHPGS